MARGPGRVGDRAQAGTGADHPRPQAARGDDRGERPEARDRRAQHRRVPHRHRASASPPADKGQPNYKNEIYGEGLGGTAWDSSKGRWPANFILAHGAACEKVGTKRVKARTAFGPDAKPGDRAGSRARPEPPAYADADGLEEVEDWRCAPGCPVADLDRQSGESTSPTVGRRGVGGGEVLAGVREKQRVRGQPGDSGGASRFFYVAKPDNGERDLGLQGMRKVSRAEAVCREDAADKEPATPGRRRVAQGPREHPPDGQADRPDALARPAGDAQGRRRPRPVHGQRDHRRRLLARGLPVRRRRAGSRVLRDREGPAHRRLAACRARPPLAVRSEPRRLHQDRSGCCPPPN
jgi:hypothetical protein